MSKEFSAGITMGEDACRPGAKASRPRWKEAFVVNPMVIGSRSFPFPEAGFISYRAILSGQRF
jgi:hypothetical protein